MANTLVILLACVGVALCSYPGYQHRTPRYRPTRHYPRPAPHYAPHYPRPAPVYSRARVVDSCTCEEQGNFYSPISRDGCRSFTQTTAHLPAEVQRCPYGLQFDVKTCVCNYPKNTVCPYNCAAAYYQPHSPARYTHRVTPHYKPATNYQPARNYHTVHNRY